MLSRRLGGAGQWPGCPGVVTMVSLVPLSPLPDVLPRPSAPWPVLGASLPDGDWSPPGRGWCWPGRSRFCPGRGRLGSGRGRSATAAPGAGGNGGLAAAIRGCRLGGARGGAAAGPGADPPAGQPGAGSSSGPAAIGRCRGEPGGPDRGRAALRVTSAAGRLGGGDGRRRWRWRDAAAAPG